MEPRIEIEFVGGPRCGERTRLHTNEYPPMMVVTMGINQCRMGSGMLGGGAIASFVYEPSHYPDRNGAKVYDFVGYRDGGVTVTPAEV